MRKFLPVATILLAVALLFAGCRTMEDMIPKQLGEPEGLWLYRGAERMRTDGSEKEPLFDEVELDGETYTAEEFEVEWSYYCTDTKTAFFLLRTELGCYLYCYNYADRCGMQRSELCEWGRLDDSEFYVCFENSYENTKSLFLRDGTPVCENMEGFNFSQDILHKLAWSEEGDSVVWWKAGELHSVPIAAWEGGMSDFYDGRLIYLFTDQYRLAVDTDTEEIYPVSYEGSYNNGKAHGGTLWFVTREQTPVTEGSMSYTKICSRLYYFTPTNCELVYSFEDRNITIIGVTDEVVYLCTYDMRWNPIYQYYDIASGALKNGEMPRKETDKTFTIGEYTFWVGYETYGGFFTRECHYLYRRHGKKVEIMQYAFDEEFHYEWNDRFFDDICAF